MKQVGSMTSAERGANISMIEAINASGIFISPMLITSRKYFTDQMLKGVPSERILWANPSGSSNKELFYNFFQVFLKVFLNVVQNNKILNNAICKNWLEISAYFFFISKSLLLKKKFNTVL